MDYTSLLSMVKDVFLPFLQRCNAEVCFEQIDEIDTGDFKYVGPGHGTYEQVTFIPEARKRAQPLVVPSLARPTEELQIFFKDTHNF